MRNQRWLWVTIAVVILAVGLGLEVAAQAPPVPAPPAELPDWKTLIDWTVLVAGFINAVAVVAVVQVLKGLVPYLRVAVPWLLPIAATVAGPLVALLQNAIAGWLGLPIDLSPILGPFTGAAAVALHQFQRQATAQRTVGPVPPPAARAR